METETRESKLNSACLSWVGNHNFQALTVQIHIHIILLKTYFA